MDNQNKGKSGEKTKLNEELDSQAMKKRPNPIPLRRELPAELMNELFAYLSLENAFGILAGMPNGLLARNARKMLKSIKIASNLFFEINVLFQAMKANKWNSDYCGPKLAISEEGLKVEHFGSLRLNSVRAVLPIPKFNLNTPLIAYFEVEIVEKNNTTWECISIGFCTQKFPLDYKLPENENIENLIMFSSKAEIFIDEDYDFKNPVPEAFSIGDVVGIGIGHFPPATMSPSKCFATCNGKLLGMVNLPTKFAHLQLFPAAYLENGGQSIRANFGQEKWRFNPDQLAK